MRKMWWHHVCGAFALISVSLISFTPPCNGGKILVVPSGGSHWINMKILLEELHARGHNMTVIRLSTSWNIPEKSPLYTSITIQMEGQGNGVHVFLQKQLKVQKEGASKLMLIMNFISMIDELHASMCVALGKMFDDDKMIKMLVDAKYDLVLTDPAIVPGVILAKFLKLPLVLNVRWITSGEGHFVLAPSPLSYIPVPGSSLTDKMNFLQRVKNMFFYSIILYQRKFIVEPKYHAVCDKYIEGGCDVTSLLQEADIWLFRSDFVFEFPRPTMPNIVYIGGFQCKPASPLPPELEDFVQSAGEHGVIIMTLGTLVSALPTDVADEIASIFAKLPHKVIWRHIGGRPTTLGNNTLLVDWMPQKDLLGHQQTKVFVAHGGTNGVQEAIYYGVPILGIPLFFDQNDNLLRLQIKGAAKIIQLYDLNADSFEQGLKEVLYQDSYRQNMQRLSHLHRDQPMTPMDQAIFWIEYVIRHRGAPHLRTEAYKMPWYSYYCFDVFMVLMITATVIIVTTVPIFRFLCCRSKRNVKVKQQ